MRKNNLPKEARFKPGQSGNPAGRPKKLPAIDELLSNVPEADFQAIIKKLVSQAKAGNIRAAEVLLDRIYGRPRQSMEVAGQMTIPISGIMIEQEIDLTKLTDSALKEVLALKQA